MSVWGRLDLRVAPATYRRAMTNDEHLLPKTDSIFDAELKYASKRYAAGSQKGLGPLMAKIDALVAKLLDRT